MTLIVNHPDHYNRHPSGVECITVAEHMNFCLGNAIKYIWRADHKGQDVLDLEKAVWYLKREIARRLEAHGKSNSHISRSTHVPAEKAGSNRVAHGPARARTRQAATVAGLGGDGRDETQEP